jgi:hypothetical protein
MYIPLMGLTKDPKVGTDYREVFFPEGVLELDSDILHQKWPLAFEFRKIVTVQDMLLHYSELSSLLKAFHIDVQIDNPYFPAH